MDTLELNDGQLAGASGGARGAVDHSSMHDFVGDDAGRGAGYLCPKCGRPVQFNSWLRFYCESCNESWYYASELLSSSERGA